MICDCKENEYCSHFNRRLTGKFYLLAHEDSAIGERYRALLMRVKGGTPQASSKSGCGSCGKRRNVEVSERTG
jgi:hypothetical protein